MNQSNLNRYVKCGLFALLLMAAGGLGATMLTAWEPSGAYPLSQLAARIIDPPQLFGADVRRD